MKASTAEQDPTFTVFLPILCALWSDGLLEEDELRLIHRVLDGADWVTPAGRSQLSAWLDVDNPPDPSEYERAKARVRGASEREGITLARAGLSMAAEEGREDGPWSTPAALTTLAGLESKLGLAGPEALRELVGGAALASAPAAVDLNLTARLREAVRGDSPEVRSRIRELLSTPEMTVPDEIPRSEYRERALRAVRILAREGIGALAYPSEFGGGGDPAAGVVAFEELALGDLSVLIKYGVQFGLFGGSIAQLGTDKHHDRYLARVGSMEIPGCYGMTETGHGSNVRDIETTATYDHASRDFVIHTPHDGARKDYIGNAALHGQMATVFAQLMVDGKNHGVHALLVPIRHDNGEPCAGVRIEDCGAKEGLNGVDNGRLWFDQVRVGQDALLDRFAQVTDDGVYESQIPSSGKRFFTMLGTLVAGRISIAAASNTVTKKALTIAIRYTAGRTQFGPTGECEVPVLDYLSMQRALLPKLAKTYGLSFAMRDLIRRFGDPSSDKRELEVRAAGLKAVASWHAMDTLQSCREACGGKGYLLENQFGQLKADTDVFTTFEGANTVLLQLVSKGLLSGYRRELGHLSMWGMMRHLAEVGGMRVADLNPIITRRSDPDHLTDPSFHAATLAYRQQRLLRSVARRLKGRIDDGMDSFTAMNECQDHVISLALAHVDLLVLESFQAAFEDVDAEVRTLLEEVAALFALSSMEEHRGWYLEAGHFEPAKSRAIRGEVNRLCGSLRSKARELVDAFDIPAVLLRAPIAEDSKI